MAAATALTSCGGAQIPNEGQADTIACRGYVLSVGGTDLALGRKLMNSAQDGTDAEDTKAQVAPVRAAAAGAGGTAGLSDATFKLFRDAVVTADGLLVNQIVLDDGTETNAIKPIADYQKAVAAVHKHCY
jgi:hypothetical protein